MTPKIPKHWPLTVQDIIQERVNWEDRYWHMHDPEPEPPKESVARLKMTPALITAMGGQMFRRSVSLMTP